MKILFDHQCFVQQQYGGISRYYFHLIKELNRLQNVNVDITIKYSNNFYLKESKENNVKPFFPRTNFSGKITLLDRINRVSAVSKLKKAKYDIFHPTYYNPYFLKYLNGKPFIITVYDSMHEKYPEIMQSVDRTLEYKKYLLSKANFIIAISNNTKNDLIKFYNIPDEKIKVVYLAASVNKQMAVDKEKLDLPEKYILYVGKRDYYKNFNKFLIAVEPLLINNPELYLIAAGGGKFNNEELKLFESKKLLNKILYRNADDSFLASLYSNAAAFIFPSLYEGFGIPALEAMNCGCPVIMSNTSSLPEVGGDAAIYFDPTNTDDMRHKIEAVIFSNDLRNNIVKKSEKQRQKFSFEKTAIQTLELYRQFLEKRL